MLLFQENEEDNGQEKLPRVISIIHPMDSYSTTILTANLATILARQGHKIVFIDLNFTLPTLAMLLDQELTIRATTNDAYLSRKTFEIVINDSFKENFSSGGQIRFCYASPSLESRLEIQRLSEKELNKVLSRLMTFIKKIRDDWDFIFLNMPVNNLQISIHGMLLSDLNILLIDHNQISISYGLKLVHSLETVHPLIEFHGLLVHRFRFSAKPPEEEKTFLEAIFQLPVISVFPELPQYSEQQDHSIELKTIDPDPSILKFYKDLTEQFFRFIAKPIEFTVSTSKEIEVIIIAGNAGIPLFTAYLHGGKQLGQGDILTSAAITAIISGISGILQEIAKTPTGETKLIQQKYISIIIEDKKPIRAIMVTNKKEKQIRPKLINFLSVFKSQYLEKILNFKGNIGEFKGASQLIDEIF